MNFARSLSLIKKFRFEIIALIFSVYGMYLRFVCFANRQFWLDEAWSLQAYRGAFKPIWQRYQYTDISYFPGDYLINWPFVSLFKDNKWGVSIPHILFTVLGFYFLYLICKRYFRSIFAWVVTFVLIAVHRELIFHSFEFRPYAVLPTLALAVFYFSEQIVSSCYRISLTKKALIGSLFVFTIMYHAYGIIIVSSIFAYFLLCELRERGLKETVRHSGGFINAMILIGLPIFIWYSIGTSAATKGARHVFQYIPNPAVDIFGFLKTVLCCLIGNKILYLTVIFLISPFVLPYKERFRQIMFLFMLVILPIMAILLISCLAEYWFLQRQFIWVMPLFAFLIGWCVDASIGFIQQKKGKCNG